MNHGYERQHHHQGKVNSERECVVHKVKSAIMVWIRDIKPIPARVE